MQIKKFCLSSTRKSSQVKNIPGKANFMTAVGTLILNLMSSVKKPNKEK